MAYRIILRPTGLDWPSAGVGVRGAEGALIARPSTDGLDKRTPEDELLRSAENTIGSRGALCGRIT